MLGLYTPHGAMAGGGMGFALSIARATLQDDDLDADQRLGVREVKVGGRG